MIRSGNSAEECLAYTQMVGSSNLSRCTKVVRLHTDERLSEEQEVVGSIPTTTAQYGVNMGRWRKGSVAVLQAVGGGSIPLRSTK